MAENLSTDILPLHPFKVRNARKMMRLVHILYISVFCVSDCSVHERETQKILNRQSGIDSFNELDGK